MRALIQVNQNVTTTTKYRRGNRELKALRDSVGFDSLSSRRSKHRRPNRAQPSLNEKTHLTSPKQSHTMEARKSEKPEETKKPAQTIKSARDFVKWLPQKASIKIPPLIKY